ncbi:hypothetical protein ACFQ44_11375 [Levilactobacillus lanxiensis]|uniref:Surface layer protein A domain-containing protein n=1 Tax=Levilactobacillus lanxiensis TaxID=2799568 RepID=A0ABW4D6N9_9LACO|nr:hypothetical protein [Levilactobacillus lanxiensis]
MRKSLLGLLVFGGLIGGGLVPQTAYAAKSHPMLWMHARAASSFHFRKSGYKHYAYTLHKVKHNRYRLKRAYRLGTMKNKVVHQVKAISLGGLRYEYDYVTYKGKGVWVCEKYLTGFRTKKRTKSGSEINSQVTTPTTSSTTTTMPSTTTKSAKSTTATTTAGSKTTSTATTNAKLYIKDIKHLSWQDWLSLPDLKGEVNGLTFYYVDDVPYDEDGFPYVTQSLFSVPMQVRIMKNSFTPAAYKAITDKWDTYYVSEKHALFCPTNTEVGQKIRDNMPD